MLHWTSYNTPKANYHWEAFSSNYSQTWGGEKNSNACWLRCEACSHLTDGTDSITSWIMCKSCITHHFNSNSSLINGSSMAGSWIDQIFQAAVSGKPLMLICRHLIRLYTIVIVFGVGSEYPDGSPDGVLSSRYEQLGRYMCHPSLWLPAHHTALQSSSSL